MESPIKRRKVGKSNKRKGRIKGNAQRRPRKTRMKKKAKNSIYAWCVVSTTKIALVNAGYNALVASTGPMRHALLGRVHTFVKIAIQTLTLTDNLTSLKN